MRTLLLLLALAGCTSPRVETTTTITWHAGNEAKLAIYLSALSDKPDSVAIFDWDNTVIKNDVGDLLMLWLLDHDKIMRPKWSDSSSWLSPDAVSQLEAACPEKKGRKIETTKNLACADSITSIYFDGKTKSGKAAWKTGYNKDLMEPAYAWLASLFKGYAPEEIYAFAQDAISAGLNNSTKSTIKVGTRHFPNYVRVYPQMNKLIHDLKEHKAKIWVVSASPQVVVEAFAKYVGISRDQVIGIRNAKDKHGKYLASFEGCGNVAAENQKLITYRQGKRCWINKHIFKMPENEQLTKPSPISFAAGDSDTDVFFLRDATDLKVVINRNRPELMCLAYANQDGKWLVNPMFIDPRPALERPYSCKAYGLPDQVDLVF